MIKQQVKKIAIFRALQLGDLLCAIPAIRSLRNAFPEAEITLVSLPWAKILTERFSQYFNRFIHFPGYAGLPEQVYSHHEFEKFTALVQQESFDLLLQMQGNGTIVNDMLLPMNARQFAGFCLADCSNRNLLMYPEKEHEIMRHVLLMKHIGIESTGTQLEFPVYEKDYDDYNKLNLPVIYKKYVCIHPGSRGGWRQWPPAYFAALADYFVAQGFSAVITGTEGEREITTQVINTMQNNAINATGRTGLGAIGVLIKNAFMLISNCTGVSHIAAALEVPSIVISMDGEPFRWAPLNNHLHKTTDWTTTKDFNAVFKTAEALYNQLKEVTIIPDK